MEPDTSEVMTAGPTCDAADEEERGVERLASAAACVCVRACVRVCECVSMRARG
jgi:hypothetical protein